MFKSFCLFLILFVICVNAADSSSGTAFKNNPTIVVIPVSGTVDPSMAAFMSRALQSSREYPKRLIILEIDTYGGQVDAAFQIVDTLMNSSDTIYSYVKTKAISAGALIALAGKKLIMKNGTTIGDVAPLTYSEKGPEMLGEKFQSPIRAKFRTLAKRNGYPEILTEAMVTKEISVYEVKFIDTTVYLDSIQLSELKPAEKKKIISTRNIVSSTELLTMDDVEAQKLGFSSMSVSGFDEMIGRLGLKDAEVVRIQTNWSEKLASFIATIAPILMAIGFAALYIELKTPGFGVPGIIGIICLAAVFFGQYMTGLADYTELLLLAIGAVLLAIEIFVTPGFGLIGITGILIMVIGMVLSLQDFVIPKPEFPWQAKMLVSNLITVIASFLGSMVIIILFFRYVFPKVGKIVQGPYLQATLIDVRVDSDLSSKALIGQNGIVCSALHPAGKAMFNGEVIDVVAEGEFIEKDTEVTISEINGNRIVVTRRVNA
ncbi:MAG TPA: NfeD family protein [Chitinispirillaceae bacterium]|nr:NfeD family protein [Chitinispirillaceae bacterium]